MVIIDKHNIGLVIKRARKKAKLKQYQLAEMAGFTDKHLSRIENGKYLPKLEHFLILASILHLNLSDFGIGSDADGLSNEKSMLVNKILSSGDAKVELYKEVLDVVDKTVMMAQSKEL